MEGKTSIAESYVDIRDGEAWLLNCHIDNYDKGSSKNLLSSTRYNPTRNRKLLLHKTEIQKLQKKVKEKGLALVTLDLHMNKHNKVKVEIALARGKKVYDKRETIKQRDLSRRE